MNVNVLREIRALDPNRQSHRKRFVDTCEELLDVCPIESELSLIEAYCDRSNLEQLDREITMILRKVRIKAEGETKGILGCKDKTKVREKLLYWKLMVQREMVGT